MNIYTIPKENLESFSKGKTPNGWTAQLFEMVPGGHKWQKEQLLNRKNNCWESSYPYQKENYLLKASIHLFLPWVFWGDVLICFKSPNNELSGRFAAVSLNEKWHKSCTLHDNNIIYTNFGFGTWHCSSVYHHVIFMPAVHHFDCLEAK